MPMMRAPPDTLRYGWHKASEDVKPEHPVQRLESHVRIVYVMSVFLYVGLKYDLFISNCLGFFWDFFGYFIMLEQKFMELKDGNC